jgi:hypothetical protein
MAEMRKVSVLFLSLRSDALLSLESSNAQNMNSNHNKDRFRSLNSVLCSMQRVILRYEGFIRQFLVDEKGCTLIAVFGIPMLAHEGIMAEFSVQFIENISIKTMQFEQ